ncbi:hypothetical protein EVAR_104006_1 [Eumeta japonica]|uniref:Uncharacterized protein n=1 Tax=Eumeta variegata TaxID=151549 RepID=A0A4C1XWW6_EUMVA|nr:hypothetical protein EVAR_104006_1 [Eumeta japonica]
MVLRRAGRGTRGALAAIAQVITVTMKLRRRARGERGAARAPQQQYTQRLGRAERNDISVISNDHLTNGGRELQRRRKICPVDSLSSKGSKAAPARGAGGGVSEKAQSSRTRSTAVNYDATGATTLGRQAFALPAASPPRRPLKGYVRRHYKSAQMYIKHEIYIKRDAHEFYKFELTRIRRRQCKAKTTSLVELRTIEEERFSSGDNESSNSFATLTRSCGFAFERDSIPRLRSLTAHGADKDITRPHPQTAEFPGETLKLLLRGVSFDRT